MLLIIELNVISDSHIEHKIFTFTQTHTHTPFYDLIIAFMWMIHKSKWKYKNVRRAVNNKLLRALNLFLWEFIGLWDIGKFLICVWEDATFLIVFSIIFLHMYFFSNFYLTKIILWNLIDIHDFFINVRRTTRTFNPYHINISYEFEN